MDARLPIVAALLLGLSTAVEAQTSTARIEAAPLEEYVAVKSAMAELFDAGVVKRSIEGDEGDTGLVEVMGSSPTPDPCPDGRSCEDRVNLATCRFGQDFLTPRDDEKDSGTRASLADIAFEQEYLARELTKAGYPVSVWRVALSDRERARLRKARQGGDPGEVEGYDTVFLDTLSSTLNAYRKQHNPALPETMVLGECGDAEDEVRIATDPSDGRAWFISIFDYKLCRKQGIDPDDETACDTWCEPVDGVLLKGPGDYQYKVVWPDGYQKSGRISLADQREGEIATFRR